MPKAKANRLPVREDHLAQLGFKGEWFAVPKPAIECPVFSVESLARAVGAIDMPGEQLTLFEPEPRDDTLGFLQKVMPEATQNHYRQRAKDCREGTCPFIGQIATCFRRPKNETSRDPNLFK